MQEQTKIQKINNQKWISFNKDLLSPRVKIDRKLFSMSPTSVLTKRYNPQEDWDIELKKNSEQAKKKINKRKRERNAISPSADYKKIYKTMTHVFRL